MQGVNGIDINASPSFGYVWRIVTAAYRNLVGGEEVIPYIFLDILWSHKIMIVNYSFYILLELLTEILTLVDKRYWLYEVANQLNWLPTNNQAVNIIRYTFLSLFS